jgi:hypothetical protein
LCGVFLTLVLCVEQTFALMISEIQFDPVGTDTDREWVEIFNDTSSSVDLTTYKFFENNTNHGIDILSGDKNVESGEYVVLVQDLNKFKTDYPNYSGKIFKSSFSLSNTGESLSLKDKDGNILNAVNYSPSATGAGNGLTISFDGANYVKGEATPGSGSLQVNTTSNTNTTSASTTTATTTTNDVYTTPVYYHRSYWPESEKVYVTAGENKIVIVGADVPFEASAVMGDKRLATDANYFWNFGDDTTAEGKKVFHSFKFPGEYIVVVDAYAGGSTNNTRVYVKVVEPSLSVKLDKYNDDKFVQINNTSNDEVELGGFLIKSSGGEYEYTSTLSKHFSILPMKSVKVGKDALKFATSTTKVVLTLPNGKELSSSTLATSTINILSLATTTTTNIPVKNLIFLKKKVTVVQKKEVPVTTTIAEKLDNPTKFIVKDENSTIFKKVFAYFGI